MRDAALLPAAWQHATSAGMSLRQAEAALQKLLWPTWGHVLSCESLCCRNDCHEDVAALMLYLVRAGHLTEAQQITTIMLINKCASALNLSVLIQILLRVLPRLWFAHVTN